MNMLKSVSLVGVMGFGMLVAVACSRNDERPVQPQQQVQQQQYAQPMQQQVQPQVVYVQQPPVQQVENSSGAGNMMAGAALGGLAGYALGNHGSRSVAPQQVTKTVVVNRYIPTPRPSYYSPRPSVRSNSFSSSSSSRPKVNLSKSSKSRR